MRNSKTNFGNVGAGYLKYENFVKFIDMNPFVKQIELSDNGEIFLNPDIIKILKYGKQKNIILEACNGVNFNKVSDEILESLVKYNFRKITIAIDGASQETYSKYRRGGNFDTVINNIKKLNEYKKKYSSGFPILLWQYIIMDTNDNKKEIDKAIKLANDLNMTIYFIKTWNSNYKPKNKKLLEELTGLDFSDENIKKNDFKQERWIPCLDLWNKPQINWDGRFLGCCCNYLKPFDINIFETGLTKCLKSRMIRKTKKMLMGGKPYKKIPCYYCSFYKKIAKSKNFIKKDELK